MTVVPLRKTRRCGPKTKTGCQTCKIRRVKCDEAKPFCQRCSSTGRKCDGYFPTLHSSPNKQCTSLVPHISIPIPGTSQEKRGFQFFIANTAEELTGYYTSSFWEKLILQASTAEPALRHAVIAIGSLHEEFMNERQGCLGGIASSGSSFAINQYTKAIRHLRRSLSTGSQAPLTALMSCILFVCFDALRGFFESSMIHLQAGMKILKDLRSRSSEDNYIVDTCIAPLFMRLGIQSILYIDTRSTPDRNLFATELAEIQRRAINVPAVFESLEDARTSLNETTDGLFRMFYMCDGDKPMTAQPAHALEMHLDSLSRLKTWNAAFSTFMSQKTHTLAPRQLRGAALLIIHQTIVRVMAEASPGLDDPRSASEAMNDIDTFDSFTPDFQVIVSLARGLVAAVEQDTRNGKISQRFSTDLGLVGPLYYVCVKCASVDVRQQAMELLERCPRREGMWHSGMAIGLIKEYWEIEERHRKVQVRAELERGSTVPLHDVVDLVLSDGMKWEWRRKGPVVLKPSPSRPEEHWLGLLDEQGLFNVEHMYQMT